MSDDERLVIAVMRATASDSISGESLWWYEDKEGALHIMAQCSDVFYWGTADGEEITWDNLEIFEQTMQECIENHGKIDGMYEAYLLFCARVRKMRPQGAYYTKHIDDSWKPLFDAAGPPREVTFTNPGKHPDDE